MNNVIKKRSAKEKKKYFKLIKGFINKVIEIIYESTVFKKYRILKKKMNIADNMALLEVEILRRLHIDILWIFIIEYLWNLATYHYKYAYYGKMERVAWFYIKRKIKKEYKKIKDWDFIRRFDFKEFFKKNKKKIYREMRKRTKQTFKPRIKWLKKGAKVAFPIYLIQRSLVIRSPILSLLTLYSRILRSLELSFKLTFFVPIYKITHVMSENFIYRFVRYIFYGVLYIFYFFTFRPFFKVFWILRMKFLEFILKQDPKIRALSNYTAKIYFSGITKGTFIQEYIREGGVKLIRIYFNATYFIILLYKYHILIETLHRRYPLFWQIWLYEFFIKLLVSWPYAMLESPLEDTMDFIYVVLEWCMFFGAVCWVYYRLAISDLSGRRRRRRLRIMKKYKRVKLFKQLRSKFYLILTRLYNTKKFKLFIKYKNAFINFIRNKK